MFVKIGKPGSTDESLLSLLLECHGRIRSFLALAETIASRADLPAAEVVDACARVDRYYTEALPLHVLDEEESLRPRLRGREAELDRALGAMGQEHRDHQADLRTLGAALAGLKSSPGDPQRRAALGSVTARLRTAFEAHLAAEEGTIFPAIARLLDDAERQAIVDEARARRRSR